MELFHYWLKNAKYKKLINCFLPFLHYYFYSELEHLIHIYSQDMKIINKVHKTAFTESPDNFEEDFLI